MTNSVRLVVEGDKSVGLFTEKGGVIDCNKIAFPHYSCKDTITKFGFVKDFDVAITKDRYVFFEATPVNATLPTHEELLNAIADNTIIDLYKISNGFIYENHIILLITTSGTLYRSSFFVITKDADTGDILYKIVVNATQKYFVEDDMTKYKSVIVSKTIYKKIGDLINDTSILKTNYNLYNLSEYIVSGDLSIDDKDLLQMFTQYYSDQIYHSTYGSFEMRDFDKYEICDKFYYINYGGKNTYYDDTCKIIIVLNGKKILIELTKDQAVSIRKKIAVASKNSSSRINKLVDQMREDLSFVKLNACTVTTVKIDESVADCIVDAYNKGYIVIMNTGAYYIYKAYIQYPSDQLFIRWNAASDYKDYEFYDELNKIIRKEDDHIRGIIKSIGKNISKDMIEYLKEYKFFVSLYKTI